MNTAFSLAEEDEKYPGRDDGDLYNLDTINYKSPSLPLHFDKKYLPSNFSYNPRKSMRILTSKCKQMPSPKQYSNESKRIDVFPNNFSFLTLS